MMRWRNTLVLVFLVSMFSCNKSELPNDAGTVLFKFDGLIDSTITFEAGENNYFMHTDFADNGNNDVLIMRGEFQNKSTPNDNYLRFEFYGYDSVNNLGVLQNVFNEKDYYSYSTDTTLQTTGNTVLKFNTLYGTGATINWDFDDGTFGTGDEVTHSYSPAFSDATVKMNSFYPIANCGDSVSNFIDLRDPVNDQVQFNVNANTSLDSFAFTASGFSSYIWDLGNQNPQNGPLATAFYTDSLRKTIQVTALKPGISSNWKAVITPNNGTPCFAAFMYTVVSTPVTSYSQRVPYKTCVITYKKNGVIYSSHRKDNSNQSNRKIFTLDRAGNYIKNESGQETIRLNGSVDAFLYNVNNVNDSIPILSTNVSVAVAHP